MGNNAAGRPAADGALTTVTAATVHEIMDGTPPAPTPADTPASPARSSRRFAPTQFPAPVVWSKQLGDFVVCETRYRPGEALPLHSHEFPCLVVVLEGTFFERADGRARHGAPGMIIVRPEGEPHSDRFDARGGRCLNVEVAPRWLACMEEGMPIFERSAAFAGGAFAAAGRRLGDRLTQLDEVTGFDVETLLLAFAAESADSHSTPAAPPRWLLRVRDRIHSSPASRLRLVELAAEAGVHPVHLATSFRRFFRVPVAQYVRRLRVEYACRAIASSESPLAEIALDAGFADQSHLGRTFKRTVGMTPAGYRRRAEPR